mmetsp:Transcript_34385/g.105667  ORF Transcript_34385/g.105667 Transcript_34385/m.105667 type:complete len:142 (+) Transcript_34385:598-1023(+)
MNVIVLGGNLVIALGSVLVGKPFTRYYVARPSAVVEQPQFKCALNAIAWLWVFAFAVMLALQLVQTLLGLTIQSSAGLGLMIAQIAVLVLTFLLSDVPSASGGRRTTAPKTPACRSDAAAIAPTAPRPRRTFTLPAPRPLL